MKRFKILLPCFVVIAFFLVTGWAYTATLTVDNLDDTDNEETYTAADGKNTLRKCLRLANSSSGEDVINFSISGVIYTRSLLPELTDDGTLIDASSRWVGAWPSGQPGITLDGSSAGGVDGLRVAGADRCQIRGLFITGFKGNGVVICKGSQFNIIGGTGPGYRNVISNNNRGVMIIDNDTLQNAVIGNYIGTDVTGVADLGNSNNGVSIGNGAQSNTIGGTTSGGRNIISGNNEVGIAIWGSGTNNNRVTGNYIGTDATGSVGIGNMGSGVSIFNEAQLNTIGGKTPGERNIISGNSEHGVAIWKSGTNGNRVTGNYIGTDATGSVGIGNTGNGVSIGSGVQSNTIGGTTPGERNIISGNKANGVLIIDSGTNSNKVTGNYIGTDVTGAADLGNSKRGVLISNGAQSNTIGGTTSGERNIISGNNEDGVAIVNSKTDNNRVIGNYIGTDVTGTVALGNTLKGVRIEYGAQSNIIGGTTPGERNIISGNSEHGVVIWRSGTDNNRVTGNYIGTDITGTIDLGNAKSGVWIGDKPQSNIIGGTTTGERNIISGNEDDGVIIIDSGTNSNKVIGNHIGTDITGTADLGNAKNGVSIGNGAQSNIVGVNRIAFNRQDGVKVFGNNTNYNKISHNAIYNNANLGINLADGGNDEIQAPTIVSAYLVDSILSLLGFEAGANAVVDIFKTDSYEGGEGKIYIGSLTSDGDGNFLGSIDVIGKDISIGDPIAATTTYSNNNTSEFSPTAKISFEKITYAISISAGSGGSITPSDTVTVEHGSSQIFTIRPDNCYVVKDVKVDGSSVGAVTTYTFSDVKANRTIEAAFEGITYTITASTGSGGSITPSGTLTVSCGRSQVFTMRPDNCYVVKDVRVDGSSVGAVTTYTLSDVKANHTIEAAFEGITYSITASAGSGGSITPSGTLTVNCGGSQVFTIRPDNCYVVKDVRVDGSSVGAVTTYTFSDVKANHTIYTTFGNEMPSVTVGKVTKTQYSNVLIKYTLNDIEKDTLNIICTYFRVSDNKSQPAIVTYKGKKYNEKIEGITEKDYEGEIIWNSRDNLPSTGGMDVKFVITPEDCLQKGKSGDTGEFKLVNLLGDYNSDGKINSADLVIFQIAWDKKDISKECGPATGEPPDLTPHFDGKIDFEDLAVFTIMWVWSGGDNSASPMKLLTRRQLPGVCALHQNYPNPFNPETWIPFQLAEGADVVIKIYSSTGQLVRALNLGYKEAGFYTSKERAIYWDGRNEIGEKAGSGVYFYTIKAADFIATRKMLMQK